MDSVVTNHPAIVCVLFDFSHMKDYQLYYGFPLVRVCVYKTERWRCIKYCIPAICDTLPHRDSVSLPQHRGVEHRMTEHESFLLLCYISILFCFRLDGEYLRGQTEDEKKKRTHQEEWTTPEGLPLRAITLTVRVGGFILEVSETKNPPIPDTLQSRFS